MDPKDFQLIDAPKNMFLDRSAKRQDADCLEDTYEFNLKGIIWKMLNLIIKIFSKKTVDVLEHEKNAMIVS